MNLDSTAKSIQVVLAEVQTTTTCDVTASYIDNGSGISLPASNDTGTNGTTPVTAVGAPFENIERIVDEVLVYNKDTVPHFASISLITSGVKRVMQEGTIQAGDTLIYEAPAVQPS